MNASAPIKVLLIDNHLLVLEGLQAILETYDHIDVVGVATLAMQGLEIARREHPDVVVMDINMPELNGLDAIERFKEEMPSVRLLMLSMHDRKEYISTSVLYGASGYVLKDVSTEEIVEAIEKVAAGGNFFSTGVSDVLLERMGSDRQKKSLTSREQEILMLIAGGKSNKEVADRLDISIRTVETHRKKIKKKVGVATTAGLTRWAIENGIIG